MHARPVILLIADRTQDSDPVVRALRARFDFAIAGPVNALTGLRACATRPPACAVVHLELRDISGPELCRLLRGRARTATLPLVLFSSRGKAYEPPEERVSCANAFFSRSRMSELVTAVANLAGTQIGGVEREPLLTAYEGERLRAHFDRVEISIDGDRVDLTRRELSLLRFLVTHRNRILTRHDLLQHVWNGENDGRSRTIDTHVARLRAKLNHAGDLIQTVKGIGYRFNEQ